MNGSSAYCMLNIRKTLISFQLSFPRNNYAKPGAMMGGALKKKKLGKMGPTMEKKVLPVETDPIKLATFVCGANIYKTGEEVALKPNEEYPDWLWDIRLGSPPPLEELDPNSKEYWRRIRKMAMRRNNKISQLKQF
ncbi:unnamed protein product [Phaedon cochleariae]|uniref:Large ribosomal subunit protein mL54 n=1 Tax=Phaedon cochleariae TaxID=80249 RepID=A0A9P0DPF7_PHACE|nr:unnamed protein product [Phaedon cochleariae]CAH1162741.1 unnamed protein product [Phaedon cochleariae]